MQRYRVFGYSDAPLANTSEGLIAAFRTPQQAIAFATNDVLATCVIDHETDEVLWRSTDEAEPTFW